MNYTPKQHQIMEFIQEYREKNQVSPTLEEIGASLGIHRVTVHQHVGLMIRKGALAREAGGRSRNLTIIDPDFMKPKLGPLLAEHVKCSGATLSTTETDGKKVVVLHCSCGDDLLVEVI